MFKVGVLSSVCSFSLAESFGMRFLLFQLSFFRNAFYASHLRISKEEFSRHD